MRFPCGGGRGKERQGRKKRCGQQWRGDEGDSWREGDDGDNRGTTERRESPHCEKSKGSVVIRAEGRSREIMWEKGYKDRYGEK